LRSGYDPEQIERAWQTIERAYATPAHPKFWKLYGKVVFIIVFFGTIFGLYLLFFIQPVNLIARYSIPYEQNEGPNQFSFRTLAFSPDGKTLAGATDEGVILLWDVKSTEQVARLSGHSSTVNLIKFSPDGSKLVSAGYDNQIIVWDMAAHSRLASIPSKGIGTKALAFRPDGQSLITASADRITQLFSLDNYTSAYQKVETPANANRQFSANDFSFTPDGKFLAEGDNDYKIRLWKVDDFANISLIEAEATRPMVTSLKFSPDGKILLARGSTAHEIEQWLWDITSQRFFSLDTLEIGGDNDIMPLAFSPDSKAMAALRIDQRNHSTGTILLLDVTSNKVLDTITDKDFYNISALDFSPDGHALASVSYKGSVKLWRIKH
jgi:WD40 repeat protein